MLPRDGWKPLYVAQQNLTCHFTRVFFLNLLGIALMFCDARDVYSYHFFAILSLAWVAFGLWDNKKRCIPPMRKKQIKTEAFIEQKENLLFSMAPALRGLWGVHSESCLVPLPSFGACVPTATLFRRDKEKGAVPSDESYFMLTCVRWKDIYHRASCRIDKLWYCVEINYSATMLRHRVLKG